jgi:hypothetical protein
MTTVRPVATIAATVAMLVCAMPARAQPWAFALREPISFHGARLVGFEGGVGLRTANGIVRPSDSSLVFVTIKIEIDQPFEYVAGRFREITLSDERGQDYWYCGWLTDEGWIDIDDSRIQAVSPMKAEQYPAVFGLTFEVPSAARRLVLHYGTAAATLFALPPP